MKTLGWLACLAVIAVGLTSCIEQAPTEAEKTEIKDYPVYYWNGANYYWFVEYHPTTNVVDSFTLPYATGGFALSADGQKMYVPSDGIIGVVDVESRTVIQELQYSGPIAISPDNQLMAIMGEDLYILNTNDYSVVHHDTISLAGGVFSANSKRLYCYTAADLFGPEFIVKIDTEDGFSVSKMEFDYGYPVKVSASHDETKWFLYFVRRHSSDRFIVFDVEADSVIFQDNLSPGRGEFEVTPDGRYVFYTNPGRAFGSGFSDPPPPYEFYRYDISTNQSSVISTEVMLGEQQISMPIGNICITPDSRWVVCTYESSNEIISYDIMQMQIAQYMAIEGNGNFLGITCQMMQ